MTESEQQSLAVWGRIADALETLAAAVTLDDNAPGEPICEHPPEMRIDFGGMGSTEENWECRCGHKTPARLADLAAEVVV